MIARPAAAAAALLLSGCAALFTPPQTAALITRPPTDLPVHLERHEVPFFAQTRDHCGPAALATALADIGLPADADRLADAVFLPSRGGSLQLEMLGGARRHGAVATRLPADLTALLREVAAGHAVVVLQNLGLKWLPRWHYAVVVGYDLGERSLILRSGAVERQVLPLRTFDYTWTRAGRWAIAVLPPERLPSTATETEAQQAALGFERAAPPARSAVAWRTLLGRWPDNLLAGIGLGNALNAAGDAAGARAAFESVTTRHDSAVAWINLARLRLDAGDPGGARAAADRAVSRTQVAEPAWRDAALAIQAAAAARH